MISLLDVLCEMTSDHKQFMFLQDHPDLLDCTVGKKPTGMLPAVAAKRKQTFLLLLFSFAELLLQVHAVGKASKNIFSATQNFCFSHDGDPSSHSPVVSFKAHLIRLIGNLCHSNANNQNKVRVLLNRRIGRTIHFIQNMFSEKRASV